MESTSISDQVSVTEEAVTAEGTAEVSAEEESEVSKATDQTVAGEEEVSLEEQKRRQKQTNRQILKDWYVLFDRLNSCPEAARIRIKREIIENIENDLM